MVTNPDVLVPWNMRCTVSSGGAERLGRLDRGRIGSPLTQSGGLVNCREMLRRRALLVVVLVASVPSPRRLPLRPGSSRRATIFSTASCRPNQGKSRSLAACAPWTAPGLGASRGWGCYSRQRDWDPSACGYRSGSGRTIGQAYAAFLGRAMRKSALAARWLAPCPRFSDLPPAASRPESQMSADSPRASCVRMSDLTPRAS
jgi:hypothetical protein